MNANASQFNRYENQKALWTDCRFFLADVPLDRRRVQRMLPLGLGLARDARATLFVVDYRKPNFTAPYKEAGLMIHVRTVMGQGLHCCWMVVDDDTALIYGRELLGYPKKMADLAMEEKDGQIKAHVTRRGVRVLSIQGTVGQPEPVTPPVIGRKIFNVSGPGQLLFLQPIWLSRPKEIIHASHAAHVTLCMRDSVCDPIAQLISGPAVNGRFVITSIPGASYLFPVGLAGPLWLHRNHTIRYR